MTEPIRRSLALLLERTAGLGLVLEDEKPIDYGVQLKFRQDDTMIMVNLYHSVKKGVSLVFGGKVNPALQEKIRLAMFPSQPAPKGLHQWNSWVGTDECGKGDFFGPLVAAGFHATTDDIQALRAMGIQDSKNLTDPKIEQLAKTLYAGYRDRIRVLVLDPPKYNDLYAKFVAQGKKLNELLAWMHGRLIVDIGAERSFQGALVDKFCSITVLKRSLKELKSFELIAVTKAEADVAVAAASIIARYHFVVKMDMLSKHYGMRLPKGASRAVIEAGRGFVETFGEERLSEVAKMHFKTRDDVLRGLIRKK